MTKNPILYILVFIHPEIRCCVCLSEDNIF